MTEEKVKKSGGLSNVMVDLPKIASMTIGEVFGTERLPVTQITKRLWEVIKRENLLVKK